MCVIGLLLKRYPLVLTSAYQAGLLSRTFGCDCSRAAFTPNNKQIIADAKFLATLDFDRAFPSHQMDRGPGLSKAQLQEFAATLAA